MHTFNVFNNTTEKLLQHKLVRNVSLRSLQIPHTHFAIDSTNNKIITGVNTTFVTWYLTPGGYTTGAQLINAIQTGLDEAHGDGTFTLELNPISRIITLTINVVAVPYIELTDRLMYILGFTDKIPSPDDDVITGFYPINLFPDRQYLIEISMNGRPILSETNESAKQQTTVTLPVQGAFGSLTNYDFYLQKPIQLFHSHTPVVVESIGFKIKKNEGGLFDFQNVPFIISLEMTN